MARHNELDWRELYTFAYRNQALSVGRVAATRRNCGASIPQYATGLFD